ncbi:MAG: hypothetical protein M1828_005925 [Chrysothrix sp. TS-e1954]|nr:MAG: hypothetical protein M1828_005925 [Chrysothrix sp. TS-e1954]
MSGGSSAEHINKLENGILQRETTAGGHTVNNSQPELPVYHRKLANPTPLGLLAFGTGIFFISCVGVNARGITTSNMIISIMIFYGGCCQFLVGIMEFVAGNTFGATVFSSYAALHLSYGCIYLPGSGIIASYTDSATGQLTPEFNQALGLYYMSWFILTFFFTIGACRSSWVVVGILAVFAIELLIHSAGLLANNTEVVKGAQFLGFIVMLLCYWGALSGLYGDGATPFNIPTFNLHKQE